MKASENLYVRGGVYWIRYNVNGRKVRRSLGTDSLREAQRLKREILGAREVGDQIRAKFGLTAAPAGAGAPVPTVAEVASMYLGHIEARGHLKARSLSIATGIVNNWIVAHFGTRRISDVTRADVELFVGTLRKAKKKKGDGTLGKTQIVGIFRALARLFRYALREHLFYGANPCDLFERNERPKANGPRQVVLTEDEAERLLGQLEGQMRDMALVALHAGLRWGEVAGLHWDDIDLDSTPATLTVRRSYQGDPKNAASAATVPLHDELASLLKRWREDSTSEWLFPSRIGEARRRMSGPDRKTLHTAAQRAGIKKHITPHVFRHTFGTLLYAGTTDPKAVQRLLRHAAIETTMRVYVKDDRPLVGKVNALPVLRPKTQLRSV